MRGAWLLAALLLAGCSSSGPADGPTDATQQVVLCPGLDTADACDVLLPGVDVNEFGVAANPLDPLNAIVVGNDYGAGGEAAIVPGQPLTSPHFLWGSWWWTKDGGQAWTRDVLPGRFPETGSNLFGYEFVGDLVVEFGPDGTAYMSGIGYSSTSNHNAVFFTTSSDGGETFTDPVLVDSSRTELVFHDKPALLVAADGSIVIAWNIDDNLGTRGLRETPGDFRVAVSRDGGETWQAQPLSEGDVGISASLAQTPDGVIHCVWRAYSPLGIQYSRSTDNGATWSETVQVHELESGSTVTPNAPYRTFVLPALTATPDGRLLMVLAPKDNDDASRLLLISSTDGGDTWVAEPFGGTPEGKDAFLPAITSHPDGRVAAAWLDRRLDDNNEAYHAWVAYSNGSMPGPNGSAAAGWRDMAVSSGPSEPGGTNFIGDYMDVAISQDRLYVAFPDLRDDGSSHLRVATLEYRDVPLA